MHRSERILHTMLQFANQQLLLLFGKYVVRHVTAFDEDAGHVAAFVSNRLINEIKKMLCYWLGAIALESYWQSPTNKWCASRVNLVEEFKKPCLFRKPREPVCPEASATQRAEDRQRWQVQPRVAAPAKRT